MEQNRINPPGKIMVKSNEPLSKFKHMDHRYNLCRERSNIYNIDYFLPNENYYDATFFH